MQSPSHAHEPSHSFQERVCRVRLSQFNMNGGSGCTDKHDPLPLACDSFFNHVPKLKGTKQINNRRAKDGGGAVEGLCTVWY